MNCGLLLKIILRAIKRSFRGAVIICFLVSSVYATDPNHQIDTDNVKIDDANLTTRLRDDLEKTIYSSIGRAENSKKESTVSASNLAVITGKVIDENGEGLPGAAVVEKGTQNGTITDADGIYKLDVSEGSILVVAFVGYETVEIQVGNQAVIDFQLQPDVELLKDVVVIGYGSSKKSDLTGSVSSIKGESLTQNGFIGLEQSLAGRAAGVVVTQNSGTPGAGAAITIRGISSLSGSQPLYVIDGIPLDNTSVDGLNAEGQSSSNVSPLSLLNPADIRSIEILKDASATAIYGSRGANGVVLITTKTGTGKMSVEINHETIFGALPDIIDVLDANEWTVNRNEAFINNGLDSLRVTLVDSASVGLLPSRNWQEEIFRETVSTNTSLSFSGGDERTSYLLSANVLNAEGIVEDTDFTRVQTRLNLSSRISDKLKVGSTLTYSSAQTSTQSTNTNVNENNGTASIIRRALIFNPSALILEEDTEDGILPVTPLTFIENNDWDTQKDQFIGNLYADLTLAKGLSFKTTVTYQSIITKQRFYQNNLENVGIQITNNRRGWARTRDTESLNYTNTNQLNYTNTFGQHQINVDLGQSLEWRETQSIATSNFGFPNDLLTWYAPQTSEFQDLDLVNFRDSRLASFFGRLRYSYKNKLLFTFTSRYDGSSKFAANNKWAFFPAASMAYKFEQEQFMENISAISQAKVRVSYGIVGNQAIQEYQSLAQLAPDQFTFGEGSGGEGLSPIFFTAQLPNSDLRWETTAQLDIGLDLGLFDQRIIVVADYFKKNTEDLLIANNRIPSQSGFSNYTENFGKMESEGFELGLDFLMVEKGDFSWNLNINASSVKAIITDLSADEVQAGVNFGQVGTGTQRLIIGEEVGTFFGLRRAGIAQFDDFVEFQGLSLEEQIALYNQDRTATYTFIDGYTGGYARNSALNRPGQQLYFDIDGDSVITELDKGVIGQAQPDIMLGISNRFKYKGFDLSIFVDAQLGKDITNVQNWSLLNFTGNQQLATAKEAWTPQNQSTEYPRLDQNNLGASQFVFSDRYVEDGSFVRLQNVTIGYTLPTTITDKLNLSALRLYASGSNLLVFTDYSGYNPDVNLGGNNNLSIGHDNAGYPLARLYTIGATIKF
ncbi:MAG: TonB-dependent receptor [Bacteroidota bacterium]